MSRRVTINWKAMTHEQRNEYMRWKNREQRARWKNQGLTAQGKPFAPLKDWSIKTCPACKQTFPRTKEYFYVSPKGSTGACRPCTLVRARAFATRKYFGISWEEYKAYFVGASCAICGATEKLVLDHCHARKKVRGVLCHPCNLMLGSAEDNLEILQAAIDYLQIHQ